MDAREFYNAYVLTASSSKAREDLVEKFLLEIVEAGEIDGWILTIEFREASECTSWAHSFKGLSSPEAYKKLIQSTEMTAGEYDTIEIISPNMFIFEDSNGFVYRHILEKIGTGEQEK